VIARKTLIALRKWILKKGNGALFEARRSGFPKVLC
jgi:hypothetical protein